MMTHTLMTPAANEHDLNQMKNLLHGEEELVSAQRWSIRFALSNVSLVYQSSL